MALGRSRIPDEFKDEDKWLRFFSKKQILVTLAFLAVGILCAIPFFKIGFSVVGVVFIITSIICGFSIVTLKVPDRKYLFCGGAFLYILICRIIRKKLPWNKKIYVKNIKQDEF